jgi:hypothetical protein
MLCIESAVLIQSIQIKEQFKCTAVGKNVFNMSPKSVGPAVKLSKVKRNKTRHVQLHNCPVYKYKSGLIIEKMVYSESLSISLFQLNTTAEYRKIMAFSVICRYT